MELFEPYKITPYSDFSQKDVLNRYRDALEEVRGKLGRDYPLTIGGEEVTPARGFIDRSTRVIPSSSSDAPPKQAVKRLKRR